MDYLKWPNARWKSCNNRPYDVTKIMRRREETPEKQGEIEPVPPVMAPRKYTAKAPKKYYRQLIQWNKSKSRDP